jgi:hypothetical protein
VSVRKLTGRCLCGAIRYEVADAFRYAANCHCERCRRATGSAYKPFAGIEREQFRVTAGADGLLIYGDAESNHDVRCKICGSLLCSVVRDGAWVHVALGTLDTAPTKRPTEHIFVGSKAAWEVILDDLPQYEGHAVGDPMKPAAR